MHCRKILAAPKSPIRKRAIEKKIKGTQSKIGLFQKWLLHPYITLKTHFRNLKSKKRPLKKVENFGALARISSLKESAIWTTYSWNFGKIFGHVIAIIKP